MEQLEPYKMTILMLGLSGFLLLVQLLVADVVGIFRRQIPGYPVNSDHDDLLFRAARAHANNNESIAVFVLFAAFGIASGASPETLNAFSLTYFLGRLAHTIFYYSGLSKLRSMSFGLSVVGLLGMFTVSVIQWF